MLKARTRGDDVHSKINYIQMTSVIFFSDLEYAASLLCEILCMFYVYFISAYKIEVSVWSHKTKAFACGLFMSYLRWLWLNTLINFIFQF